MKVYLNGFLESWSYVKKLSNITYVGTAKSSDGYSYVECYETI